ncbi:MAG TPA: helix-turn-helix transcriptional regulator [Candidatus Binataceae bacterium]|nr:helix-turn-helix transcriptional regulator [Candidatus Binataceae bacterium]
MVERKTLKARPLQMPEASSDTDFLATLGGRVRDARARHGMTRKMLARDSGISERYLAEMEAGRGNFSIMMLKKLASAIDVPLGELVDDQAPPMPEYTLIAQRLRTLPPKDLNEAGALLARRFGRCRDRGERIALIGLRGAGKSTLGSMLAKDLGYQFFELSHEIAAVAGVSIEEIFELEGQAGYRRHELRALRQIVGRRKPLVFAVGGGLVAEPAAFQFLLDSCYTVWLRATPQEHWERVMRQGDYRVSADTSPSAALADMRRILSQREPLYAMADATLDTSGRTVRQSAKELTTLIGKAAQLEHAR